VRVWVTRAQPGAERTAQRLHAHGHDPLVAPLLEVRALPVDAADLAGAGALAFTSANAVAAYAALTADRSRPVFAVGDSTAAAARAAGFSTVDSAAGDVEALAARIGQARGGFTGSVLHPAAQEPAGDLAGALVAAGVPARAVAVYDTDAAEALPPAVDAALAEGALDAVLVHSPKAGRALARLLAGRRLEGVSALALSPACAAPLAAVAFARLEVAPLPNEAAMLALLADEPRRKMLGPAFWVALTFGLACIALGAAVAIWGPDLFPSQPPAPLHR
jgi:uroporphyrinogen-III synthase